MQIISFFFLIINKNLLKITILTNCFENISTNFLSREKQFLTVILVKRRDCFQHFQDSHLSLINDLLILTDHQILSRVSVTLERSLGEAFYRRFKILRYNDPV